MIPPDDVFEGSYLVRLRPVLRRIDRVAFPVLGERSQIWALEITVHPDDERDQGDAGCVMQNRAHLAGWPHPTGEGNPWAAFLIAVALAWSTAQRKRQARRAARGGILMGRPLYPEDFAPRLPLPADPDAVVFATGQRAMRVRERITMRVPIPPTFTPTRTPVEVRQGPPTRGVPAEQVERLARGVCPTCEKPLRYQGAETRTLVGYGYAANGHAHDDNCRLRGYQCPDGHQFVASVRRRCEHDPPCDWIGKPDCFCHVGPKLDAWPDVPKAEPIEAWMR